MTAVAITAALLLAQATPARTLTYDDAIREALAHNNDLKAARARLDQARTIGWKAWASQLPQITAAASWTRNDERVELPAFPPQLPEVITLQPLVARGAQVQATLPVFAPRLWLGIAAAEAGQKQAELTVETARREILFGVAQVYYGAVGTRFALQITEKQLAIAQDHERDARVRHEAGTTPRVALLRAEIDRARAEQDLEAARAAYESARVALATLLDRQGTDFDVEEPTGGPLAE
ncbi:MAG TPA: TolC family protein, partial [Anaeromyxobacter sp.]